MSEYLKISEEIRALGAEAEREIRPYFSRIEEICDRNTEKVLAAFAKNRVSDNLFAGTTGYGYDDYGRDTLDENPTPTSSARKLLSYASALSTARMPCPVQCSPQ